MINIIKQRKDFFWYWGYFVRNLGIETKKRGVNSLFTILEDEIYQKVAISISICDFIGELAENIDQISYWNISDHFRRTLSKFQNWKIFIAHRQWAPQKQV